GIPAERQQAIFNAFEQADGSTTREYGGTGLGLAISARLVELRGGRPEGEGKPGEGSAFHLTAPLWLGRQEGARWPAPSVPSDAAIMMLTSGGQPGDLKRCRELGVQAYLTKPVKQSDLLDGIVAALGVAPVRGEPAPARPADRASARRLRVLLAEDNLVNQTLVLHRLQQRGDSVVVVNNGREA